MTSMRIVIIGKKKQDLYLTGHYTNVTYDFIGRNQTQVSPLKFADMIQDCACSLSIRYILRASTRPMGDLLLRMALLWIPALQQALVVLIGLQAFYLGLDCVVEDVQKNQPMESFQLSLSS